VETDIPTVSEVVRRAATICDPAGDDVAVTALVERFSDDDRPARSVDGLHSLIHEELNLADPAADDPAAAMTAACAAWLATNIEQGDDRELVLREASRVAFDGRPPEPIAGWLERQGVSV
jgi:hypothetical protein